MLAHTTMTTPPPSVHGLTSPRRALLIHNPAAGRSHARRLQEVIRRLTDLGVIVTLRATRRRGDAETFAREASADEFDVVIAAGGDGTVNEVVNGLVAGASGVRLAVVPLGTANVLACEIGLDPKDTSQIARTIAHGPARTVHLGTANGRHFVLMAGVGLDAHVVAGVNGTLKRHTGKLAYVVESLRQVFGYDFPALQIRANGRTYEGRMAVACKGRFYGGPFIAAPGAKLDDPKLHVCILPMSGATGMVRYGMALPMGKLAALPEVQVIASDSIVISGPRGAPVQGDGDIVARLPAEISVGRDTVELVAPE
jgi:diacylglycerol kinase (ATP)